MRTVVQLMWMNPLGGFDTWPFIGYKDHGLEVVETGTTTKNTFPQWPKSYGAFADTVRKQTYRKTRKTMVVRSQALTSTQVETLGQEIKSSPLVQIVTDRRTKRTVILDDSSFTIRKERDRLHTLSFTITYTDDLPSQTV